MKKDYATVTEISLLEQKKYLLNLCSHGRIEFAIHQCISERQIKKIVKNKQVNQDLYQQALIALYQCQNFESLEYHLIMMNFFFHYQSYNQVKKQLFQKICQKSIGVQEYCVLRHLVNFNQFPLEHFIKQIYSRYEMDPLDCAKICILEDQYYLAYDYLKQLDNCEDENLLYLLQSYSLYDYISLKKYYQQKSKSYVLLPTH